MQKVPERRLPPIKQVLAWLLRHHRLEGTFYCCVRWEPLSKGWSDMAHSMMVASGAKTPTGKEARYWELFDKVQNPDELSLPQARMFPRLAALCRARIVPAYDANEPMRALCRHMAEVLELALLIHVGAISFNDAIKAGGEDMPLMLAELLHDTGYEPV